MDDHEVKLLNAIDRLSLNSLSKSSPSTFQLKSYGYSASRINNTAPPPVPNYPTSHKSTAIPTNTRSNSNRNNHKSSSSSNNLSHVPCKFFKQGTCTAGANCIFSHNPDPASELSVCKYYRKGNCKFGTKCALLHTMSLYYTAAATKDTNNGTAKHGNSNSKNQGYQGNKNDSSSSSMTSHKNSMLHSKLLLSHQQQQYEYDYFSHQPQPQPQPPSLSLYSPPSTSASTSLLYQQNEARLASYANNNNANSNNAQLHTISEDRTFRNGLQPHFMTVEEEYSTPDDFLLPSSLNDLLTPNELLNKKQQAFQGTGSSININKQSNPYSSSTTTTTTTDTATVNAATLSSSWNVPFYKHQPSYRATQQHHHNSWNAAFQPLFREQQQLSPPSTCNMTPRHAINIPTSSTTTANHQPDFTYPRPYPSLSTTQQYHPSQYPVQQLTDYHFLPEEEGPFFMEDAATSNTVSTNTTTNSLKNSNNVNHNVLMDYYDPFSTEHRSSLGINSEQSPLSMTDYHQSIFLSKAKK